MPIEQGRLRTEFRTVQAMMKIYCKAHHQVKLDVCNECSELLNYAEKRLDRCPYGQSKPTCNQCPIHCYKPEQKENMRLVMRYSGPRMLLPHPILAIRHLVHDKRRVPAEIPPNASNRYQRKNKTDK